MYVNNKQKRRAIGKMIARPSLYKNLFYNDALIDLAEFKCSCNLGRYLAT